MEGDGGDGGGGGGGGGVEASLQSNFMSPPRQSLRSAVSGYIRAADVWRMQNKGRTGWNCSVPSEPSQELRMIRGTHGRMHCGSTG